MKMHLCLVLIGMMTSSFSYASCVSSLRKSLNCKATSALYNNRTINVCFKQLSSSGSRKVHLASLNPGQLITVGESDGFLDILVASAGETFKASPNVEIVRTSGSQSGLARIVITQNQKSKFSVGAHIDDDTRTLNCKVK